MAGSPPQGYPPPGQQPQQHQQGGSPDAPFGVHPNGKPYSEKQKTMAGILQLIGLLGFGGIGRMYMGQVGLGVGQLVVGWVTCGLGLWWSIIEGILILVDQNTGNYTDESGRPLRPQ